MPYNKNYLNLDEYDLTNKCLAEEKLMVGTEKENETSGKYNETSGTCNPVEECAITHTSSTTSNNEKITNCMHTLLHVTCDEVSDYIEFKPNTYMPSSPIIGIVAGYNEKIKKIKFKILDLFGPCERHKKHTFDVSGIIQKNNEEIALNVGSIPFYKIFNTGVIFPWKAKKNTYVINTRTCGNSFSPIIVVYPDVKINIKIPINVGTKKEITTKHNKDSNFTRSYAETTEEREFTLEYIEDGKKTNFGGDFVKKYAKVKKGIRTTSKLAKGLADIFDDKIKVDISLPQGNINLDYKWQVHPVKPLTVDSVWHAEFKIDPLFGVELTMTYNDEALAKLAGPMNLIYKGIKKLLAMARIKLELKFQLSIKGSISVNAGLSKDIYDTAPVKAGAGVTGKVEATIKVIASVNIQVIISVEASAEAGVKTGIFSNGGLYLDYNNNLDFIIKTTFLGIIAYYNIKVNGGFKSSKRAIKKRAAYANKVKGSYGENVHIIRKKEEFEPYKINLA